MKYTDPLTTHQALAVAERWKAASQAYHDFIKEFISIVGQDEIQAHRKAKEAFDSALKFEEAVEAANQGTHGTHPDSTAGEATTPSWTGA